MIGFLDGVIEFLDIPYVVINVHGVGYRALTPNSVYSSLKKGDKIKLFTYTYVREDALELFGFFELEDLKLFENLITVSGIGPKTAMNIFSFGKREEISGAIINGDVAFFSSVPRLGTKNAQKIIIELKTKLGSMSNLDLSGKDMLENAEVVSALKTFGFSAQEINKALREIGKEAKTTEDKIRFVLKHLGKK